MKVVFLCVANSARSQMAEGLARACAPPNAEIFSAGSRPTSVNPFAIEVMAEIGVDISSNTSKSLDDVPVQDADAIITLCAEEECPLTPPGVRRISWAMPDPAADTGDPDEIRDAFRQARDAIAERVRSLWQESA